jgi:hypothetical protein
MLKTKVVGNTTVTLDYAECVTDGGKYAIICGNHSYLLQDNNKRRLWKHAEGVNEWCAACAGQDERYPDDKWQVR